MTPFTILEAQLSVPLQILINAFWDKKEVSVKKDEEHYRLNINVDWKQIWAISINWRWLDETTYFKPLFNIVWEYFENILEWE